MKLKVLASIVCLFVLLFSEHVHGQVRLPRLVSDGMVLQRDTKVNIWGWASPQEKVTVEFMGETYAATTGSDGKWAVTLPPTEAGGPYAMEIEGRNHLSVKDILMGDVWVCSGQSNMELTMKRASPIYEDIIANSENSEIRYFRVPDRYDFNTPRKDLESGNWESPNPETILGFSATAYFFAKSLYEQYHIPIGLIEASLGGSPVEAWLSEEALKEFPHHLQEAKRFRDSALIDRIEDKDRSISRAWYLELRQKDKGYENPQKSWFDPEYDDTEWPTMTVPGYWADGSLGPVNGVVWFRKDFEVPAAMVGKPAKLLLGRIVDSDSVFINGTFVGTTGYQYPPRRYSVPSTVLKLGKNTIVVRVISNSGKGGFVEDKPYQLSAGGQTIDLSGEWKYQLGATMNPLPGQTFVRWKPMGLYNGMISPLLNYTIKGVIWYQGASNTSRTKEYDELFVALINDWRKKWGQGDFPFLFVQLANFMEAKEQPTESDWAELRDAQLKALDVPNTGMAVTIDLGEWNDIHPLNKEDVGKRLALAARKVAYGEDKIVYSGPIYQSMKVKGNKVILTFSNIGSGLEAKGDGELHHFAIAGADKNFVWAKAKIKGNKVVVWHENVPNPVAVRYAWADNPADANLYNKEGLPASPFRTDGQ